MKNFLTLLILSLFISATTAIAQTDTMYFHKNGVVLKKVATNTFDSITYFKPTTPNTSTVLDIDGNTYSTVTIGTQVWMAENLKTTHYNDGTSVTYVSDNGTWTTTLSPAMSWLSNNIYYKNLYGGLYNWYAVDVSTTGGRNICPTGWHVPSDAEWTTMENYLIANGFNYDGTTGLSTTGDNKIGKAMATATGWNSYPTTGAIGNSDYPTYKNKSGFSVLPGGYRYYVSGTFGFAGNLGKFWISTQYDATNAWSRYLLYNYANSYRYGSNKRDGYSVRCVKD